MTRNLKALGLGLVAMFAMSAVVASTASAQTFFHSSLSSTTVTGTQGATPDKFITTAGSVECATVSYDGQVNSSTTKEVTVTPSYSGEPHCLAFGVPGIVHMNGCDYVLKIDPTNANTTTGTVDIVCEAGKEITVTAGHTSTVKCTVHVPAQSGIGTVHYKNEHPNIHATIHLSKITYSHTKGSGLGACPTGHASTGTYEGTAKIFGDGGATLFVG